MLLLEGCVDTLYAYDRAYKIITNARHWIALSGKLHNSNETDKAVLLLNSVKNTDVMSEPKEYKIRLLERIVWFYTCEYDKCNNHNVERNRNATGTQTRNILYSFDIDGGRIYSAFYKTYGIDIEKELDTIHWWKFMAMFNDLSEASNFKSIYMYYRSYDRHSKEYRNASPETKSKIDNNISSVVIDDETENIVSMESPLDKQIREAREKSQV